MRFNTRSIDSDVMECAIRGLATILQELLPPETVLKATYGWGSGIHPALCHLGMEVGVSWIDRFVGDSLDQRIILPGESDFRLSIPKRRVYFVFCHEEHIHSSGVDYELETLIWTKPPFCTLPLADCPGLGLLQRTSESGPRD